MTGIIRNITRRPGGVSTSDFAEYHLTTTPEVVALNDDGVTYTKIPNMVLGVGNNFSVTTGTLKYLNGGRLFLINGTSDLEANKAADVTYSLFINGSAVPSEQTEVTFTAAAKKTNISITAIAEINTNDELEVRAKGDGTASLTITVNKLDLTFLQVLQVTE